MSSQPSEASPSSQSAKSKNVPVPPSILIFLGVFVGICGGGLFESAKPLAWGLLGVAGIMIQFGIIAAAVEHALRRTKAME